MEKNRTAERKIGRNATLLMGAIALTSTVLPGMDAAFPTGINDRESIIATLIDDGPAGEHSRTPQNLFGDNAYTGNLLLLMPDTHMQQPNPNIDTQTAAHMSTSPNLGGNVSAY